MVSCELDNLLITQLIFGNFGNEDHCECCTSQRSSEQHIGLMWWPDLEWRNVREPLLFGWERFHWRRMTFDRNHKNQIQALYFCQTETTNFSMIFRKKKSRFVCAFPIAAAIHFWPRAFFPGARHLWRQDGGQLLTSGGCCRYGDVYRWGYPKMGL